MQNQLNKILKILFAIEFILILIIIVLFFIDDEKIPTAYAVKENLSIKTEFKAYTKAVCEEKPDHVFCRDVLFVRCNSQEYVVDDLENFTKCDNLKLNLSDAKVTGYAILRKE